MEITPTIDHSVVQSMLAEGLATRVDATTVNEFIARTGLVALLFTGLDKGRPEGHDVAVALREFVRAYGASLQAGLVAPEAEGELKGRFRVAVLPSLVLLSGGEVLEVLPRVRDWGDYASAFKRYLGPPAPRRSASDHFTGEPQ